MTVLVDVVNFNADASCLSSERWLNVLTGSKPSKLYRWLELYVKFEKKVALGFTGATVADISRFNPECINLINEHMDIFEIIWRPFAHDIALLRTPTGFSENAKLGWEVLNKEFKNVRSYFLPPEFMITNEQITLLCENGGEGVFINPERFSTEIQQRIPQTPYQVRGVRGCELNCIPFCSFLTESYLSSIYKYDCRQWNCDLNESPLTTVFSWRDGETVFFIPDGIEREGYWLDHEDSMIRRQFLEEVTDSSFSSKQNLNSAYYRSYPVHSFSAWMRELRMLGFLQRVRHIEERLHNLTTPQKLIWFQVINSDILSAVEKEAPLVRMKPDPESRYYFDYQIQRSERGFEGEDYLLILEQLENDKRVEIYLRESQESHIRKLRARMEYLTLKHGELIE